MRRALLRPSRGLRQKSKLRQRNPERRDRLDKLQFNGSHADRIRSLPCCTCGEQGKTTASHVKTCGSGGRWWHIVPQCWDCHRALEEHRQLPHWPTLTRLDLLDLAAALAWQSHDLGLVEEPECDRPEDETYLRELFGCYVLFFEVVS